MSQKVSKLVERANLARRQADRARRLAASTTASDVAEGLRSYASKLDQEAGELEENAVAAATAEQKSSPSKPQKAANEATKGQHNKPAKLK